MFLHYVYSAQMQIASYSLTIRINSISIIFSQIFTRYHRLFSAFQVDEFCCQMWLQAELFIPLTQGEICFSRRFSHNSDNTV